MWIVICDLQDEMMFICFMISSNENNSCAPIKFRALIVDLTIRWEGLNVKKIEVGGPKCKKLVHH
jgi:hypothetical protein